MPIDATQMKVDTVKSFGASVIRYDKTKEDIQAIGKKLQEEKGTTFISSFDNCQVIAGQGTSAKELFEEVGELDYLFVCVGGGGTISGCAIAA